MVSTMEIERAKRYKDKTNIIIKRAHQIESWVQDISSDQFQDDDRTKLATYKAFQEIVEACMDMVAMMCKDMNLVPKDDYSNIENLGRIDRETKTSLAAANGLHSRLVHRYNQTDDRLALESINALLPDLSDFVEMVELWIKERL
ncbi:MAG: DUF86 domain-containing protein [Methanothrix sp.]|nr:DUF86 domain-containing protein [Methanothrix sp.]